MRRSEYSLNLARGTIGFLVATLLSLWIECCFATFCNPLGLPRLDETIDHRLQPQVASRIRTHHLSDVTPWSDGRTSAHKLNSNTSVLNTSWHVIFELRWTCAGGTVETNRIMCMIYWNTIARDVGLVYFYHFRIRWNSLFRSLNDVYSWTKSIAIPMTQKNRKALPIEILRWRGLEKQMMILNNTSHYARAWDIVNGMTTYWRVVFTNKIKMKMSWNRLLFVKLVR